MREMFVKHHEVVFERTLLTTFKGNLKRVGEFGIFLSLKTQRFRATCCSLVVHFTLLRMHGSLPELQRIWNQG